MKRGMEMHSGSRSYEKPAIEHWSAAELDSIEASMSGGGGGGGTLNLKWDDYWVDSGSEGDYSLEISLLSALIAAIACKGLEFGQQLIGASVSAVASWLISNSIPVFYYTRKVQHLYLYSGTAMGGYAVWDLVGSAVQAEYYGDADHNRYAGRVEFNDVPSMFSYMLSSLRW